MRLNLFEGARRLALVLAVVWAGGCLAFAALHEPFVTVKYTIGGPSAAPVLASSCEGTDVSRYFNVTDAAGDTLHLTLCFQTIDAGKGKRAVPYAPSDDGRLWIGDESSPEVVDYFSAREAAFRLSPDGMAEAKRQRRDSYLERWKDAATWAFGGITIGWILAGILGWVVRGFLGIPRGHDFRTEGAETLSQAKAQSTEPRKD